VSEQPGFDIVQATIQVNEEPVQLVVPPTGELISLGDAANCLRVLTEIRELETRLREAKGVLTDALAAEFSRQGTKTLELGGIKATLGANTEIVWDTEVLEELRDLGLPEERMGALVTSEITYKVNALVAKQIAAANPAYAEVIERAKTFIPKTAYVTVRRG
jgi:hypothetical protein